MEMDFKIEPDVIYVLDKNETLLAMFKKDDKNTIINPKINKTQNSETTFTFSIAINNPKWEQIKNPENLYIVNDMMFSTNFEGSFEEIISDNGEEYINVIAYERQKLLSRKFVRAWNSTTGFDVVDTFMVVVLSNGDLPLKNNGQLVNSTYTSGSSGYVLDALLYGTGWTTGICDVEGTFDFETDLIDIYENILKVQEIWGGILVFDSLNKKVHHRDETKFLPYSGYEVKYAKNMQSSENRYNNKIITKLCPLGEGNLNIKSVNDGSEWLTNYTYTDTILEGIVNNPDITEPNQLKAWGERKLQDLCKPSKELTVQTVLLNKIKGYELEELDINHIVDVINYQGIENTIEQLRVVNFEYNLWDFSDATIQLSDITLESTDIFKKAVKATNEISEGTLNSSKIIVYYKGGSSVEENIKRVDQEITKTKSDFTKADDEIRATVTQTQDGVNNLTNTVINHTEIITTLGVSVGDIDASVKELKESTEQSINDIKVTSSELSVAISNVGGNNLIRNSAMINDNNFWLAHAKYPYQESDIPPDNPAEGTYWYCTANSGNYIENQMYVYNSGWKESELSRKTLLSTQNYFAYTTSNEYWANGKNANENTLSGRVIKLDGRQDYTVSHIFNITEPITLNQNENKLAMSYLVKNNIIQGSVGIGLMLLDFTDLTTIEKPYSIYEPGILLTPDDLKDLTKIENIINIPKKSDFIPVVVSNTAPTDTTKNWLDTSIYLPKVYNADTSQWELLDTRMSLYNEETREIWTYRYFYGLYYQTPVSFDTLEIKSCYVALTFYPAFAVYTGDTEPIPYKGLYWNNQTTNLVKRAKYNNTDFVEWETLDIPSSMLPSGASLGVPMFDYIVPIKGFFEIADLKLEYNTMCTQWTQFPGEVYGKNYKMDEKGFWIQSNQNTMFIDEDEILATYKGINIFQINKDLAYFYKIQVTESIEIGNYFLKTQQINSKNMLLLY
jgi:hypothetical protein